VVDDDIVFLEMLKDRLEEDERLNVTAFKTGEECVENLHLEPHIVILDHYLNSSDRDARNGLEILRAIMNRRPQTRVVILSGQEDGNLVYDFNSENAWDYVIKDEDAFENLDAVLDSLLEDLAKA